jgi:Protein of unknown function (DUF1822)
MNSMKLTSLPIPLSKAACEHAAKFAAEQSTPFKKKCVYLNTLAVCAVHDYCKWIEIETNLTQGDCWQPGLRAVLDVADLEVPGIGKLECRPVLPGEESFTIPLEATSDRTGYIAVQFHEQLDSVDLLGFALSPVTDEPIIEPLEIPLTSLLSLDSLLNFLYPEESIVNLREWLERFFRQHEWQTLEELVPRRFRNSPSGSRSAVGGNFSVPSEIETQVNAVSRAKLIELKQVEKNVILVVQIISITTEENVLNIRLRLYPDDSSDYLPRNLKITALDETGSVVLESQPRHENVWTELELLDCHPNERFSVRISLGDYSVTEEFCI